MYFKFFYYLSNSFRFKFIFDKIEDLENDGKTFFIMDGLKLRPQKNGWT